MRAMPIARMPWQYRPYAVAPSPVCRGTLARMPWQYRQYPVSVSALSAGLRVGQVTTLAGGDGVAPVHGDKLVGVDLP
jgi:hypothetical protein